MHPQVREQTRRSLLRRRHNPLAQLHWLGRLGRIGPKVSLRYQHFAPVLIWWNQTRGRRSDPERAGCCQGVCSRRRRETEKQVERVGGRECGHTHKIMSVIPSQETKLSSSSLLMRTLTKDCSCGAGTRAAPSKAAPRKQQRDPSHPETLAHPCSSCAVADRFRSQPDNPW